MTEGGKGDENLPNLRDVSNGWPPGKKTRSKICNQISGHGRQFLPECCGHKAINRTEIYVWKMGVSSRPVLRILLKNKKCAALELIHMIVMLK